VRTSRGMTCTSLQSYPTLSRSHNAGSARHSLVPPCENQLSPYATRAVVPARAETVSTGQLSLSLTYRGGVPVRKLTRLPPFSADSHHCTDPCLGLPCVTCPSSSCWGSLVSGLGIHLDFGWRHAKAPSARIGCAATFSKKSTNAAEMGRYEPKCLLRRCSKTILVDWEQHICVFLDSIKTLFSMVLICDPASIYNSPPCSSG
jgi:hypothetical protein